MPVTLVINYISNHGNDTVPVTMVINNNNSNKQSVTMETNNTTKESNKSHQYPW